MNTKIHLVWEMKLARPNIEVEIDVTDKTLFFIRPYHAKQEDKNTLDKEMKRYVTWVF